MTNTEHLNPQESLNIITDAIHKTKENLIGQSFYYLLWGWLVALAALADFLLIQTNITPYHFLPWFIITPIGIVTTIVYSIKSNNSKPYHTHLDTFLRNLWMVLGAAIILVIFMSIKLNIHPSIFTLFFAGLGTTISGLSMKFKPFVLGGICFFAATITCLFVDESTILLINAFTIVIGYLIPAYLLKKA